MTERVAVDGGSTAATGGAVAVAATPGRFAYHCALRWSDMDAYGHVNNASFLTLYEEARIALMFVGAQGSGLTSFAEGVVVSRHEVDYLRPVDYALDRATVDRAPSVRIELWIEEVRAASFAIRYELFEDDVLASRARSVLVPYDLAQRKPRRITDEERDFLLPYTLPSDGTGRSR